MAKVAGGCIQRVFEAGKGTLTKKDAQNLLEEVKDLAQRRATNDAEPFEDAVEAILTERKLEARRKARRQQRNILKNAETFERIKTRAIDRIDKKGLTVKKAVQAEIVGVTGNLKDGRYSIASRQSMLQRKFMGNFINDLEKNDLLSFFRNKEYEGKVAEELWNIQAGNKKSITGSDEAFRIAQISSNHLENLRKRLNRAGADITKLDNFLGSQSHDSIRMRKRGKEAWMEFITPLLDERTFKDVTDRKKFLESAYEAVTTGIRKSGGKNKISETSLLTGEVGASGEDLFKFKRPSNLAERVSAPRKLHFKDAQSFLAYNNEFGRGNMMEGIMNTLDRGADNLALLEAFGSNPAAMFDKIKTDLFEKYRSEPKKLGKSFFGSVESDLNAFFANVDGTTRQVENPTFAMVMSTIRGALSMAKLGGAFMSQLGDLPFKASAAHGVGRSRAGAYLKGVTDPIKYFTNPKDVKRYTTSLGAGIDGQKGALGSKFSFDDTLPGIMSDIQRIYFKANLMSWWADSHKGGNVLSESNWLASFKDVDFDGIDPDTKRVLNYYGIDNDRWDIIKQTVGTLSDGRDYMITDKIYELPDEAFAKLVAKENKPIDVLRDDVEERLRTFFEDRAGLGGTEPTAREQAIWNRGTKRGTLEGELLRSLAMFKMFSTSVISRAWGNVLFSKGKLDVPELFHLAIMSGIMGTASMYLKDISKGRTPRELIDKDGNLNISTFAAGFIQGGGMGIIGDFAFGEFNRFGRSLTSTIAGPVFGLADDVAEIYAAAREGKDVSAKSLQVAKNNLPNLFYLRPVIDYTFMYALQEELNPGYLRRMEKRLKRETGQEFIFPPSRYAK